MSAQNSLNIGDYVVVGAEHPNRMLQKQTGTIIGTPDADHVNEYLVRLDGGATSAFFSRVRIWVAGDFLSRLPRPEAPGL
jgi:hypothetical protein